MVTLQDVANACGLSRSTVSKALNGYADVGQVTAERIRRTAQEMGYLPNVAARSLKTNRTYNLGILFSDQTGCGLTHEYFAGILNSFKIQAEKSGYHITFLSSNLGGRKMTYLEQCKYRNFDGVMIASIDYENDQVLELVKSDYPVVTIDYAFENCIAVMSDNVGGMRELVKNILLKGHTQIAYLYGNPSSVTTKRLGSFYKTLEEYGVEPKEKWILQAGYRDAKICSELTEKILSDSNRPTCIVYPDDFALIGGMTRIQDMGFRIPEDISIAGYDGSLLSKLTSPTLMTVHQDTKAIGKIAAEKLVHAVEKPRTWLPERIIVPGSFSPGKSVKNIT
jgi:DNA-binding LacI/PurR family transcriptional regulator